MRNNVLQTSTRGLGFSGPSQQCVAISYSVMLCVAACCTVLQRWSALLLCHSRKPWIYPNPLYPTEQTISATQTVQKTLDIPKSFISSKLKSSITYTHLTDLVILPSCACLSVCPSVCLSICLSIYLYICLSVFMCVRACVCMCVRVCDCTGMGEGQGMFAAQDSRVSDRVLLHPRQSVTSFES